MFHIEKLKRKNSRHYSPVQALETIEDVLKYTKENNLQVTGTPYIFTHIKLSDNSIITQTVQGLTCSPTKLLKSLKQ